jgi:hypothetical protein
VNYDFFFSLSAALDEEDEEEASGEGRAEEWALIRDEKIGPNLVHHLDVSILLFVVSFQFHLRLLPRSLVLSTLLLVFGIRKLSNDDGRTENQKSLEGLKVRKRLVIAFQELFWASKAKELLRMPLLASAIKENLSNHSSNQKSLVGRNRLLSLYFSRVLSVTSRNI